MNNQELLDLLEKVHAEIERTDTIDEESLALLRDLDVDIRHLIDEQESPAGVVERIETALQHFEVSHPVITAALSRAMEILSGAGI
jgi:hypothetical protein